MFKKNNWKSIPIEKNFNLYYMNSNADESLFPGCVNGPMVDNFYILQYLTSGYGKINIDENEYNVSAGDCIFSYPGQSRIEYAAEGECWSFIWICMSGESVETFAELAGFSRTNSVIYNCKDTRIPILFNEMSQMGNSYTHPRRMFKPASKIFELFDEFSILNMQRNNLDKPKFTQRDYIEQAVYYINTQHQYKTFSINTLASMIGLNRSYLYKIFKAEVGISPQEYLTQVRINKACDYLLLSQSTITSVAAAVGYDPLVFSRTFKHLTGMTPSEYRKKNME